MGCVLVCVAEGPAELPCGVSGVREVGAARSTSRPGLMWLSDWIRPACCSALSQPQLPK
jgi:hypothetical protein